MDPENDIEELKAEVEELKAISADTNRIVHKLRRNIWWGRVWTLVWWGAILSVSGAAYYYVAQPYIQKAEQIYAGFQQKSAQTNSWEQQAQQFFAQYFGQQPQSPQVPQSGQQ